MGVVDLGKKSIFQPNFRKISIFPGKNFDFPGENFAFPGKLAKNFDFPGKLTKHFDSFQEKFSDRPYNSHLLQKVLFSCQKFPFTAKFLANYSFSLEKSPHSNILPVPCT